MTAATLRFLADARAIRGRAVVNVDPDARELEEAEAGREGRRAARGVGIREAAADERAATQIAADADGSFGVSLGARRPTSAGGRVRGRRGEARIRRESRASRRRRRRETPRREAPRPPGTRAFPSGDARRARATRGGRAASPAPPARTGPRSSSTTREDAATTPRRTRARTKLPGNRRRRREFRATAGSANPTPRRAIRRGVSTRAIRSDRGRRRDAFNRVRHRRRRDDVRVGPFILHRLGTSFGVRADTARRTSTWVEGSARGA